jgi:RES domain-containing protein
VRIWRITAARYRAEALLGRGARAVGGRWNSPGTAVGYAAESAELAVLELLMHTGPELVPAERLLLEFELPDDAVRELRKPPRGWDLPQPYLADVQRIGDQWIEKGESLALRVPSAVLPFRANVLVNPLHPRFAEIREMSCTPFTWPARLRAFLEQRQSAAS